MHRRSVVLLLALSLALLLAGCQPAPTVAPTVATSPTLRPTVTASRTPTSRPSATPTLALPGATATQPAAQRYAGWQSYTHPTYGFSLRYPAGWTLEEDQRAVSTTKGHWLKIWSPAEPRMVVNVGYKRQDEEQRITRGGLGSGELVERGQVAFIGEALARRVLVCQGVDMTVLYGAGEVARGGLALTLALDYTGDWCAQPGLPAEVQAIADAIITSFELPR